VSDYLLTFASIVFVFFLPGLSFARVFRLRFANLAETAFYSISLSVALVVAIGFVLGNTIGINTATVLAAYALVNTVGAISVIRELWILLSRRRGLWQALSNYLNRTHFKFLSGVLVAVAIIAFNWYPGIGTHGIDMGEHVFWAKTIIATGRLPNYLSVEPLDQAVKFTYGAHLMLAQFFLLAGVPIEEYTWIPSLIGSIGVLVGVVLFAFRVTGSRWAGVVAGILYGSAYQPGAYIERGNLPDVVGYLLLVSTIYSILQVRKTPSFSFALGLTTVSVIACHQLATVILPTTILFAIVFSYLRSRSELAETLRSIFAGRARLGFWGAMLILAVVYAGTVTYVSASAASQLVTGNWRIYVPALYLDPFAPGITLGLLGIAGLLVILPRRTVGSMLLLGWTSSLIFLANALLIGIPIPDPLRFLWRLSEPFSIFGGIFVCFVITLVTRETPLAHWLVRLPRRWIRSAGALLMVAIIAIQIAGLVAPSLEGISDVWSSPPRYRHVEAFYQDDKQIGQWLASNASPTAVTANDADVDSTATWVQVYSMKLHFIYRVDFAVIVAPANYVQIYQSTKILYGSPSDAQVPMIIQRYNLTYVVAHTDEIPLFSSSPWFCHTPVFQSGGSALFATRSC
jgi:hypothetical protein